MMLPIASYQRENSVASPFIKHRTEECNAIMERECKNIAALPPHRRWMEAVDTSQPITRQEVVEVIQDYLDGLDYMVRKTKYYPLLDISNRKFTNGQPRHDSYYRPELNLVHLTTGFILDRILEKRLGREVVDPQFPETPMDPRTYTYLAAVHEAAHAVTTKADPTLIATYPTQEAMTALLGDREQLLQFYATNPAELAVKPYIAEAKNARLGKTIGTA